MLKKKRIFIWIAIAVVIVCALTAAACQAKEYKIENYDWQLKWVQALETGEVILCSERFSQSFPQAGIFEMTAKAENGKLTATDGEKEMVFDYTVEKAVAGESTIYNITGENGEKGNAVVGKTTYADGSAEYALIITFEGRAFYFKAPTK